MLRLFVVRKISGNQNTKRKFIGIKRIDRDKIFLNFVFLSLFIPAIPVNFPSLCLLASDCLRLLFNCRRLETEMPVSRVHGDSSARRAIQKSDLNQIRLNHFFD